METPYRKHTTAEHKSLQKRSNSFSLAATSQSSKPAPLSGTTKVLIITGNFFADYDLYFVILCCVFVFRICRLLRRHPRTCSSHCLSHAVMTKAA